MMSDPRPIRILMADDDAEDRMLTKEALEESRLINDLEFVKDGVELLDRLRGEHGDGSDAPPPDLILLDLNMPRKDGREAMEEIKADPDLTRIPIVILTTSKAEEDVLRSYELGANSYIQKPVTFNRLVEAMHTLATYWVQIVQLPPS